MAFTESEITKVSGEVGSAATGTARRRFNVYVRGTSTSTGDTLDLSSYVSGVTGIESVEAETYDEAVAATSSTWSSTTITFDGHTGSGRYTGKWVCY